MKRHLWPWITRCGLALALLIAATPAGAGETVLHSFLLAEHGMSPELGLVEGDDGNWYGTTPFGGEFRDGTVFRMARDGTLTTLHSFSGADGRWPSAELIKASDGNFYGTTLYGGSGTGGTVFQLTPEGVFTTVHEFGGSDGLSPAGLVEGSDGALYGTTLYGGAVDEGTMYRLAKLAGSWLFVTLHEFIGDDGAVPVAGLVQGPDLAFYGTTYYGGSEDMGTVFRFENGAMVTLHSFSGSDGAGPASTLAIDTSGKLYGTTHRGGIRDLGTIFRIDGQLPGATPPLLLPSAFSSLHHFLGDDGAYPFWSRMAFGSDGLLHGVTAGGGVNGVGTIFRVDPETGAGARDYSFEGAQGATPTGALIEDEPGIFVGAARFGGSADGGTLYRFDTADRTLTPLHAFAAEGEYPGGNLVARADGTMVGTTWGGGSHFAGTVFAVAADGTLSMLHGFVGYDGANPITGVTQGPDGSVYGVTYWGGDDDFGTVFKIAGGVYTRLHSFRGDDGWGPFGSLALGPDGNFYGTTDGGGGEFGRGTVYRIAPDGSFTLLHSFNGDDGDSPNALVLGGDGNFYGTTYWGGSDYTGTAFRITPAGEFTLLHAFQYGGIANPFTRLLPAADGLFYGTADLGGGADVGAVFAMTSSGEITVLHEFSGDDGAYPDGDLVAASDGGLYGTTWAGGADGYGTVFRIAASGAFELLYSFGTAPDGANPYGGLVQGGDGGLYGTTAGGGVADTGTVFRLDGPPLVPTNLQAASHAGGIALEWSAAPGAIRYRVYIGTASGAETATPAAEVADTQTTLTGLLAGVTYYVRVTALNAVGESLPSNEASATAPDAGESPPVLEVNTGGSGSEGGAVFIVAAALAASDADGSPSQILYRVTRLPQFGAFTVFDGSVARPGATQFTQEAINRGWVTYFHDGSETSADSFDFTVEDSGPDPRVIGPYPFAITITPVNDAPVATNDTALTNEDSGVLIDVLANDTDAESAALVVTALGAPSAGGMVMVVGGRVEYTPARDFHGGETFTYAVSDGAATTTALVAVTVMAVNDAPVVADDSADATEDGDSQLLSVLANDTDADGDALTITAVGTPGAGGQVTLAMGGAALTYTPAPDFNGTETFTYTVSDGVASASATVTVSVASVNDPPDAIDDSASAAQNGGAIPIPVLANDADVEGDALRVATLGAPSAGGTIAIAAGGSGVSYTPAQDFSGTETFTYTVSDGTDTDTAVVTVTVTPAVAAPSGGGGDGGGGSWSPAATALLGLLAALRRRRI